jgi:primosomal protein N' (replication factor Y)
MGKGHALARQAISVTRWVSRARIILLNAALGPLDYRAPRGRPCRRGAIVVAPLGPRQMIGVAWEAERLPAEEVPDARLRPLLQVYDAPPLPAPLRRLIEWTADYYLAPLASVLRMTLPSTSALQGGRVVTEYRATGVVPERLTPQRAQALERIAGRQGLIGELAAAAACPTR